MANDMNSDIGAQLFKMADKLRKNIDIASTLTTWRNPGNRELQLLENKSTTWSSLFPGKYME